MEDVDAWKELKSEIEAWPHVEGRYDIRFGGEPEAYDHTAECPDCHRTIRAHGISFGPYDPRYTVLGHQSDDCKAWRHRLWRFRHQTLWRFGVNLRRALKRE
jgi:hypothetical protein